MTNLLRKFRVDILLWLALFGGYLATRLVNLGILPIFTDEAIYLWWGRVMADDASLRFLPLVDGKPPLFMWLISVALKLFRNLDPLLAGRLVSVGAGLLGLAGLYFASYQLFKNKKLSYLSCLFYLLVPFTLFYDRFALADSLLAALGIWSLGLGVMLVRSKRLDVALILGAVVGLGRLTKSPADFFLLLLPFLLLLFDWRARQWPKNLLKLAGLGVLVYVISEVMFSILRLFPLFNMLSQKNSEFVITFSQFLRHPFSLLWGNLKSLANWQFFYLTPVVSLAVLIGAVAGGTKQNFRQRLVLVLYFLLPLLAIAAFNKRIYARYLLTFTPELLILAALGLSRLKGKVLVLASILLFALPIYTNFKLLTDPVNAPIPQTDRDQYIDGWPAGFGVKEVRQYLTSIAKANPKVVIATEGTFGLMPYALNIYQKDYPNLEILPYWPLPATPPAEITAAKEKYPTFVLIYQRPDQPANWKLELVAKYRQGRGKDYLRLYRVL